MADLCDVNVPLALNDPEHPFHQSALAWLKTVPVGGAVICRAVQVSLLRLLTNPKVMGDAVCTNTEAWSVFEQTIQDERFTMRLSEPSELSWAFQEYSNKRTRSPKLWQDAYLAAFAKCADLRLVTTDADFESFPELTFLDIRTVAI